jgi:hypothetical protein
VFGYNVVNDPICTKEKISHLWRDSLQEDEFVVDRLGLLDAHLIRKCAVNVARGNGCTKVRCEGLVVF